MSKLTELQIPVSQSLRRILILDLQEDLARFQEGVEEVSAALHLLRTDPTEPGVVEPEPIVDDVTRKRTMSLAARRRISRAQKSRWLHHRQEQTKKAAKAARKRVADRGNGGISTDVKKRHLSLAEWLIA